MMPMQHKSEKQVQLLVKMPCTTDLLCPDSVCCCSCDEREMIAGATRIKPAMSCSQSGCQKHGKVTDTYIMRTERGTKAHTALCTQNATC